MDSTAPTEEDVFAQFGAPEPAPVLQEPPDVWKTLPGGYVDPNGGLHRQAVVREMTGGDEEQLSRIRKAAVRDQPTLTLQGAVDDVLRLMVERIGDVSMADINPSALLLGDRSSLLLFIREAAYGPTIEFDVTCPHCKRELSSSLDLTKDIEVKSVEGPMTFEVDLSNGRKALVGYPTGAAIDAATANTEATTAEVNTHILAHCVRSIDGQTFSEFHPLGPVEAAREIKSRDRRQILKELNDRSPGPQLGEVSIDCVACMKEIPTPLDAFDLLFL